MTGAVRATQDAPNGQKEVKLFVTDLDLEKVLRIELYGRVAGEVEFTVLSWPRSVVVFCCCEAQISGSHTSLSLPHPHSFPLSKVDLEVFSLGFLWI